ncbi:MAG: class I SAM-dependent rRNA methyltransferase [Kiritimatiellaeota bacterium]|nr:class I SAM-dependent rRNA methyltransferase [Kiritimatiellota bacterium]
MKTAHLHPKREFSLSRRHPWIFSGAIARIDGIPEKGETVRVVSSDGAMMGIGAYSPESQIRIRMWSFEEREINASFIAERLAAAIGARAIFLGEDVTNAYRLVNAEADGLPGLIVDRYADWLVCQFTTTGAERWKHEIVEILRTLVPCQGIYERSDLDVREHEGLAYTTGVLSGLPPPNRIEITEHGCRYWVDVREGQKTGFYLDQRDNRALIKRYANGRDVLNAFSYTGGFGIAALAAGASSVTHVDLSERALTLARENTALNTCAGSGTAEGKKQGSDVPSVSDFIHGNVFEVLRQFRDEGRSFDLVVLDPPKFADSRGGLVKAARGYKDINLLGIKLLRPGGILATFSCSGLMTPDLFHKVVSDAAVDAKRDLHIIRRLQQSEDHPEGLCFTEGFYLKGLLCRL